MKIKGCVVALGTFDGVHLGHQKVIGQAVKYARKIKAASIAITFDPHPQQIVAPERGLKLLTTLKEREELFCKLGIDGVVVVNFNQRVKNLSYEKFVKQYLVDRLGVKKVFVGFDYAFGRHRAGDLALLRQLGKKYGFGISVVKAVKYHGQAIKSSWIRELITQGDLNLALKLLGRAYQIGGRVVKGKGVGKNLGFPTANLKVDSNKLVPAHGVYAGLMNNKKCAVNIGGRPTFGPGKTIVEAHVFGYKGNLAGEHVELGLLRRFREEKQFSDIDKLKDRIAKDVRIIDRWLSKFASRGIMKT